MRSDLLLFTAALAIASAARAETPSPTPSQNNARVPVQVRLIPGTPAETSGLVAVRDSETGELRTPTAAELAQLEPYMKSASQSAEGLVETTYSDGSVGVVLDGRFQSFSTARRTPSGEIAHRCDANSQTLAELILGAETPEASDEQ